jgi:hypothetical protein
MWHVSTELTSSVTSFSYIFCGISLKKKLFVRELCFLKQCQAGMRNQHHMCHTTLCIILAIWSSAYHMLSASITENSANFSKRIHVFCMTLQSANISLNRTDIMVFVMQTLWVFCKVRKKQLNIQAHFRLQKVKFIVTALISYSTSNAVFFRTP